jgi:guanyl-specific ribonuclease Sa
MPNKEGEPTRADSIKTIGGLVAVVVGVLAVLTIALVAIFEDSNSAATIASAAAGVIATIVGAYFGLKVGTDQTKTANEAQKAEAAKAQVYAAHLPSNEAKEVVDLAEKAAKSILG